jgi:uncharacterized protein (DUF924 family)
MQAQDIFHFWFTELTTKQHFAKDAALDETIRTRFGPTLEVAARCELFAWRATPAGRLAEILVLDQFSRNVYRRTTPRPAPRLCARRAGPRASGKRARLQLGAGAAQVCLHALYAQRVSHHSRPSNSAVFSAGAREQLGR